MLVSLMTATAAANGWVLCEAPGSCSGVHLLKAMFYFLGVSVIAVIAGFAAGEVPFPAQTRCLLYPQTPRCLQTISAAAV